VAVASSPSKSSSISSAKASSILSSWWASASSVVSSSSLVIHLVGLGLVVFLDQFQIKSDSIQMNIKLISYVFLAFPGLFP
jgi:hypothetical protein